MNTEKESGSQMDGTAEQPSASSTSERGLVNSVLLDVAKLADGYVKELMTASAQAKSRQLKREYRLKAATLSVFRDVLADLVEQSNEDTSSETV